MGRKDHWQPDLRFHMLLRHHVLCVPRGLFRAMKLSGQLLGWVHKPGETGRDPSCGRGSLTHLHASYCRCQVQETGGVRQLPPIAGQALILQVLNPPLPTCAQCGGLGETKSNDGNISICHCWLGPALLGPVPVTANPRPVSHNTADGGACPFYLLTQEWSWQMRHLLQVAAHG